MNFNLLNHNLFNFSLISQQKEKYLKEEKTLTVNDLTQQRLYIFIVLVYFRFFDRYVTSSYQKISEYTLKIDIMTKKQELQRSIRNITHLKKGL
jgi:hypothetical protein